MRTALTEKMIVLGVDGFEPKLAKKFMDQGKMPNLKKFVDRGAAREDLVLLGGMPTVTPPMWTTLATGAYPSTHGITAFFNQHPEKIDTAIYGLDSRLCKAEPLWNVFAEAGKETLVWHWPGSSWPPTSANPKLSVVDGTQPGAVNMGVAIVDWEKLIMASEEVAELRYSSHAAVGDGVNGCVITGLDEVVAGEDTDRAMSGGEAMKAVLGGGTEFMNLVMDESENEIATLGNINLDIINSPIKPAQGWVNTPEDAKEFIILTADGYTRRPTLILKGEDGKYDRIAIYKTKKDAEPLFNLAVGEFGVNFVDEIVNQETQEVKMANRTMTILELAEDGSKIRMWMSYAEDMSNDSVWHPKALYKEIIENVGFVQQTCLVPGKDPELVEKVMLRAWDNYCEWQADCLNYLLDQGKYEIIFSHLHNVDLIGHQIWHYAKHDPHWNNDEKLYQGFIEYVYKQTDDYLGRFVTYLDQGWTMIITSDHGLITEENHPPILTEGTVSVPVMKELGFTVLEKDENGNDLRVIDYSKTRAVAIRGGHIYINLKGRYEYGIVEPEDKYTLEEEIITALYNYKDPHTGRRVVSIALRNKDAIVLGMGGPECGDIIFFAEEGFNIIHMDSLPTQEGYFDTSVAPIFVAAGPGIKEGYYTERVIRQVDVAPTMAALGGVRMPAQSEGSVVHQILADEF